MRKDFKRRDKTLSSEKYYKYISELKENNDIIYNKGIDRLFGGISSNCLEIGLALYSVGETLKNITKCFDEAAAAYIKFLRGRDYKMGGYGNYLELFELFSSFYFTSRANEAIREFKKCTFKSKPVEDIAYVLNLYFSLFENAIITPQKERPNLNMEARIIATLFQSVKANNRKMFKPSLENYLNYVWVPDMNNLLESIKVEERYDFCGTWSLLAAALCKKMNYIPELSIHLKKYIPVSLIR